MADTAARAHRPTITNSLSPWDFSDQRSSDNNMHASDKRNSTYRQTDKKSELLKRASSNPGYNPTLSQSLGPLTASSREFKNMLPSNSGASSNLGKSSDDQPLDVDELIQFASTSYSQFSLQSAADRKQKQLEKILSTISPNDIFWDGGILSKESAEVIIISSIK
jgi:hypothetical protein